MTGGKGMAGRDTMEGRNQVLCPLRRADAEAVAALEQEIFRVPWSKKIVEDSIIRAEGTGSSEPLHIAFGVFGGSGRMLLGYLFADFAAGEGELHRIAVAPDFRRNHVGSLLMEEFFRRISEYGAGDTWLEVRAGNEAAIALYKRYGFSEAGRRKNYYRNPSEDALIFVYH